MHVLCAIISPMDVGSLCTWGCYFLVHHWTSATFQTFSAPTKKVKSIRTTMTEIPDKYFFYPQEASVRLKSKLGMYEWWRASTWAWSLPGAYTLPGIPFSVKTTFDIFESRQGIHTVSKHRDTHLFLHTCPIHTCTSISMCTQSILDAHVCPRVHV